MAIWHAVYEKVEPYIVSIATQDGMGTGFLFAYNANRSMVGFATAAHVIDHAHDWRQPIKLRHYKSGHEIFAVPDRRVIFIDRSRDSASILVLTEDAKEAKLPEDTLPLLEADMVKRVGVEVGWAGFPSIAYPSLCFFTGCVSSVLAGDDSYLIDGVAINGVSGGPVFAETGKNKPELIGTVSAYMPNRVRGDVLPGLLRAQDVTAFHKTIEEIKSFDDARAQQEEQAAKESKEQTQAQSQPAGDAGQDPQQKLEV